MKKLLYKILIIIPMLLILNYSLLIDNCKSQWVQMANGMGNIYITALGYSGNNIFAGTWPSTGIYLSTNNGINWAQTSLNYREIRSILVNGNNIFTGTKPYGVYLSTNNGSTWTQTSLNNRDVLSLAVNGNYLFAGTDSNGVYLSTNNGTNWTQTSLNNLSVWSIAVKGNSILAGTKNFGIYISNDNGASWVQSSLSNRFVYAITSNDNTMFAATNSFGVYSSTDNGVSWTQTSLNNQTLYSMAAYGNTIFAGSGMYNGVYVSTDNGVNWTQRSEGLGNRVVAAFCIFNNYIFAGTYNVSVYRRPLGELITGIKPVSGLIPEYFRLYQNYPNPFNPVTSIKFDLPKDVLVNIGVYDLLGKEIAVLANNKLRAGTNSIEWNATHFSSGIYFCRIQAGDFSDVKRMILLK